MHPLDQRADYLIEIHGRIDTSLADWFGPVVTSLAEDDEGPITTLSNITLDQAGLIGLIRHLHGLGVVLLSIKRHDL